MSHVSDLRLRDAGVETARQKLMAGESLTQEDGVRLFDAPVMELGRLAHAYARDRHGDRVFFTVNRQLNPTNVCVLACKFCDYAKKPGAPPPPPGCSRNGRPPMATRGLAPRPRGSDRPKRSSARARSMSASSTPNRERSSGMAKRA